MKMEMLNKKQGRVNLVIHWDFIPSYDVSFKHDIRTLLIKLLGVLEYVFSVDYWVKSKSWIAMNSINLKNLK